MGKEHGSLAVAIKNQSILPDNVIAANKQIAYDNTSTPGNQNGNTGSSLNMTDAANVSYEPGNEANWSNDGVPNTVAQALDELAGNTVDASVVSYEPAIPSNWGTVPTEVSGALDFLASLSNTPADASVVSYTPGNSASWSNLPTEVAEALNLLATQNYVFIYDPNASASGNVFTSFANLVAATSGLDYAIVMLTHSGTLPAGSYTMPAHWELSLAPGVSVLIGSPTTFSPPPSAISSPLPYSSVGGATLTNESTSVPFTITSGLNVSNIHLAATNAGAMISVGSSIPIYLHNATVSGSYPVIYNPSGNMSLYAYAGSTISSNTLQAGSGSSNFVYINSDGSNTLSTTQKCSGNTAIIYGYPSFPSGNGTYNLQVSSQVGSWVSAGAYTAANSANWAGGSPPTTVSSAFDRIAAALANASILA
jgi:hypothetical protein